MNVEAPPQYVVVHPIGEVSGELLQETNSIQKIDQLPDGAEIWRTIELATQFYFTHVSHLKPQAKTPQQLIDIAKACSYGNPNKTQLGIQHGISRRAIPGAIPLLSRIMNWALDEETLGRIGMVKQPISDKDDYVIQTYMKYKNLKNYLDSSPGMLKRARKYKPLHDAINLLSLGYGIKDLVDEYMLPDLFTKRELKNAAQSFRQSLEPDSNIDTPITPTHHFLRRLYLGRLLYSMKEKDARGVDSILRGAMLLANQPSNRSLPEPLYLMRRFLENSLYLERKFLLANKNNVIPIVEIENTDITIQQFIQTYMDQNTLPNVYSFILDMTVKNHNPKEIATMLRAYNIDFSEITLVHWITEFLSFSENAFTISNKKMSDKKMLYELAQRQSTNIASLLKLLKEKNAQTIRT
jgi:hypothetical protein